MVPQLRYSPNTAQEHARIGSPHPRETHENAFRGPARGVLSMLFGTGGDTLLEAVKVLVTCAITELVSIW